MGTQTVTLQKIYRKVGELEQELTELKKTSRQMQKGEFLTARQAIEILEK